jgi:hypothetical protein
MWRQLLLLLATPAMALTQTPPAGDQANPPRNNVTRFDYHHVEVRRNGDGWQLFANGKPLKEFPRETDARQAQQLIQQFRLNHYGTIGTPQPVIEYWLSDGQAPKGIVRGLRLTALDSASVRAELVQDQWCVRDDRQIFFRFGPHEDDARQAADVIRRHGFNHVGFIGHGAPSMMYFLDHQSNKDAAQVVRPIGASSSGQLNKPPQPIPSVPAVPSVLSGARQLADPSVTPAGANAGTTRIPFDWRMAQVKQENNEWKLVCGSQTLAHFGHNEREARLALSVLQRYRFTELHHVGGSKPACSYYLTSGQPPRGLQFGVSNVSFRPEALSIQERDDGYVIAEGRKVVLHVGEKEEDARHLLRVIQQHKFDHWCHVGRPRRGGMTFFVRER